MDKFFFHPKQNSNIEEVNKKAAQIFGRITMERISLDELIFKTPKTLPKWHYIFARIERQKHCEEDKVYTKKKQIAWQIYDVI